MSYYIIVFFWLLFLPLSLYTFSDKISFIGVYHRLNEEPLWEKFFKMLGTNHLLSYPLIITIFAYIKSAIPDYDSIELFYLSSSVALIALLAMRLISNPSIFLKPTVCRSCPPDEHAKIIDVQKERIISFFYSFVCAMIFLIMAYWTNYIIINENFFGILTRPLTSIGPEQALKILVLYSVFLIITTGLGEIILKKMQPMIQTHMPKNQTIIQTVLPSPQPVIQIEIPPLHPMIQKDPPKSQEKAKKQPRKKDK